MRSRKLRFALRLFGGAALILFLVLAIGIVLPRPFWPVAAPGGTAGRQVLLLSNPIHTDIALALDAELIGRFGFLAEAGLPVRDPRARFLVFGWGGREFYLRTPTWSALEAGALARALSLDASVMHVAVAGAIDNADPVVTVLTLPEQGFRAMLDAIAATFETDGQTGAPIAVGQGYGWADAFFEAKGRFNAFLGCNTWTAKMLRAGGLRTGFWTPLPPLLRWSLLIHNDPDGPARRSAGPLPQS